MVISIELTVNSGLSHNGIEPDIPGLRLDRIKLLKFKSKPHQHDRSFRTRFIQKIKRPVIVTAANSDSIALAIKSDQWVDYKIKTLGINPF